MLRFFLGLSTFSVPFFFFSSASLFSSASCSVRLSCYHDGIPGGSVRVRQSINQIHKKNCVSTCSTALCPWTSSLLSSPSSLFYRSLISRSLPISACVCVCVLALLPPGVCKQVAVWCFAPVGFTGESSYPNSCGRHDKLATICPYDYFFFLIGYECVLCCRKKIFST